MYNLAYLTKTEMLALPLQAKSCLNQGIYVANWPRSHALYEFSLSLGLKRPTLKGKSQQASEQKQDYRASH